MFRWLSLIRPKVIQSQRQLQVVEQKLVSESGAEQFKKNKT